MKKVVKKLSLAMALVTCTTMSVTAVPQIGVMADQSASTCTTQTNYLQIPAFKSTGSVGVEYAFAKFALPEDDGTVKLTVKDPYGGVVKNASNTLIDGMPMTATDEVKFTPTVAGNYTATYEVTMNGITTTTDFEITIETATSNVSLVFPENSKDIVPTKVATTDGSNGTRIVFPQALLQDKNGNFVTEAEAGVTIEILQPTATNGAQVDWDSASRTLTIDKNIGTEQDSAQEAVYKVRYEAKKGNKIVASKTLEVTAQKGYVAPDYTYSYTSSKPTTAEIGVEKVLPGIEATATTDSSKVSVYYEIEIEHNGTTYKATDTNAKVLTQNEKGEYVFTAHDEGKYVVKYTIEDFNGNGPSTETTSFTISDVADRTAPIPLVTLPYEEDEIPELDAIEAFADVQSTKDVMLLPIFATDSANGFVDNNLTLYRQIVSKTNDTIVFDESKLDTSYTNKALIFNPSETLEQRDVYINGVTKTITPEKMQKIENYDNAALTLSAGTYIVKYIAKDKLSGLSAVTKSLSLELVENYDQSIITAKPTVSFATSTPIPTHANAGDIIEFNVPTATQEKTGTFADTHLSTYVTYQLSVDGSVWEDAIRFDSADSWLALNDKKTAYTLSIPEDLEAYQYIKIIANSMNDAGEVGSIEKQIKFIGTGDGVETTVKNIDNTVCTNAKLGEKAYLPHVTYEDDLVRQVSVEILIEDQEGTPYYAQNLAYKYSGVDQVVAKGAYFIPESEGNYKVTYISTDANNNKTLLVFNYNISASVESMEANFLNIPSSINNGKAELNEKISLPSLDVYVSSDHYLEAGDWYLQVEGPSNYKTDGETYIQFNQIGDYTIQFACDVTFKEAIDDKQVGDLFEQITTKKYNVTVSDTTGPQVTNKLEMEKSFYEFNKSGSLEKGVTLKYNNTEDPTKNIVLPEAIDVVWEKSTLAVTGAGITYNTFTLDAEGIARLTTDGVTLTKDGVYSFIYTLKDANGNSTLLDAYTVDVGDVEAPELKVEEGVVSAKYSLGETVRIDMSKITADDNVDGDNLIYQVTEGADKGKYKIKSNSGTLTITVKNTTTAETFTSNVDYNASNLNFEFTNLTAGEYVLNVSLTDSSNKEATNSEIKFTVSDSASTAMSGEEVLGVVLIIVSVLMLGGVITYFVVTRKKYKMY